MLEYVKVLLCMYPKMEAEIQEIGKRMEYRALRSYDHTISCEKIAEESDDLAVKPIDDIVHDGGSDKIPDKDSASPLSVLLSSLCIAFSVYIPMIPQM